MSDSEYGSQTDLGSLFGATSHEFGKMLVNIGLRTEDKKPSQAAIDGGFCRTVSMERGMLVVWHRAKTIQALEQAGYRRVGRTPERSLSGPFETKVVDHNNHVVVGADGNVDVWVRGDSNAKILVDLLNLWHQHRACL